MRDSLIPASSRSFAAVNSGGSARARRFQANAVRHRYRACARFRVRALKNDNTPPGRAAPEEESRSVGRCFAANFTRR